MVAVALLSLGLIAADAQAARLGGGGSFGRQRSITPYSAPRAPQQAQPAPAPAARPAQPSGMSRWLGPLAGLALGAGLASLFMHNGGASGLLMIVLLAVAAMFAFRLLRSKREAPPLQYAGDSPGSAPAPGLKPAWGSPGTTPAPGLSTDWGNPGAAPEPAAPRFPPGFDAEQFAHHAKLNFTQLQAANDKRDLSMLRDFMTTGLYEQIAAQLKADGSAPQHTEVVTLNAEVLEVVTEGDLYIASVRFSGMIREQEQGAAAPFSELWHLEKPVTGTSGWLICGIQQD